MREIKKSELEQLKQYLKDIENETVRNLDPFFDFKMFELDPPILPSAVIGQAFPKSKPEKAQIFERSQNEFTNGIINFFSQLEYTNQEKQLEIAIEFLEAIESCIKIGQSKIWEYNPDESFEPGESYDELYDFIALGFTYIIVDENQCLIIHGGYCD